MSKEKLHPEPVIPFWNATPLLFLSILFFSLFYVKTAIANPPEKMPVVMACPDGEPITRWNRLSPADRSLLKDNDPNTNVTNFETGLRTGGGTDLFVDISVSGAPNAQDPGTINNRIPNRWGLTSFNNGRASAGESGNLYCFTFNEPVDVVVTSHEHAYFWNGEEVRVTAKDDLLNPVNLTGTIGGPTGPATVTGSGTAEVHFQANQQDGWGVWWEAASNGTLVKEICVEYYREGSGQGYYGREPFSLLVCGADRYLFDDAFAAGHPDNPNPGMTIRDDLTLSKEIVALAPVPGGATGNIHVTFRMTMTNQSSNKLTDLQLEDDLRNRIPGSAFVQVINRVFGPANSLTVNPGFKPSFDGINAIQLLNGNSGEMQPGDVLQIDLTIEMDPDDLAGMGAVTNQSFGYGFDPLGSLVTATSDAPAGQPGDTGGEVDPLLLQLPGMHIAKHIAGVDYATSGKIGNFDVITEMLVQNTGNVPLTNFSLPENLGAPSQLGSAFVAVTGPPQIIPVGANGTMNTAAIAPDVNASYNGTGNLLTGGGTLLAGEIFIVRFRYEVDPDAPGAPSILKNQVTGQASAPGPNGSPVIVTDASDSGYVPQSNNFGRPGDTGGSNDPTPLTNCWNMTSGGLSCNQHVQVSMNQACIASLHPDMVLEGESQLCSSDELLPSGAYYEVASVTTLSGVPVPDGVPGTVNIHEIDGSYVGQTLTVKIKNIVYKNTCWGYIHLEDKLGPVFDCPTTPIQADCDADLAAIPPPDLVDNCDPDPTINQAGELVIDNNICDDGIYRIRRTYNGYDQYGNPAVEPCIVNIELTRPGIEFPKDVSWHCEQYAAYPNIIQPTPLNEDITDTDLSDPDIDAAFNLSENILQNTGSGIAAGTGSGTIAGSHAICGFNVVEHSNIVSTCGNSFKIIRTWTVIDWCTGDVITTDIHGNDNIQTIKIEDKTPPEISKAPFTVNANVAGQHPFPCVSQGFLPGPDQVSDNCNGIIISIITPVGEADYMGAPDGSLGGLIPPPGLTIGTHEINYRATDSCGNSISIPVMVEVVDEETPAAVCDEFTDVNLTSNGTAEVFAATFNDGSNDNCCIDDMLVRRMTDPCNDSHDDLLFGPSVKFCCEDVGAGPQMVVFRVFDCYDNFNDCMVQVTVNDKQGPTLVSCPPTSRIDCIEYSENYQANLAALSGDQEAQSLLLDTPFGTATFFDNCGFSVTRSLTINLDQCSEGSIIRTWIAIDNNNSIATSCSQTIRVDHVSNWVVEFPEDIEITCGNALPTDFGAPEIFFDDCEMIGESYTQDTFTVVPDACFKIVRTWAIINWCVVGDEIDDEAVEVPENALGLPFPACDLDGDGDCDDHTFRDSWNATDQPNINMANQQFGPDTDPDINPWDGYIEYQQIIKVQDETDPVFTMGCDIPQVCIEEDDCLTDVILPTHPVMDCSPEITLSVTSDLGVGFGPFNDVGEGVYNVTYTAMDNCNNQQTCQTTVTVVDCKAPTIYCKEGFIAVIMDTSPPMVPVSAWQLDDGSDDNCSDIVFSFSSDVNDTIMIFDCDDAMLDSVQVEIWVTDEANNQDFCVTHVTVQDNLANSCDNALVADLSGFVETENGAPVQHVDMNLTGHTSGQYTTDPSGYFIFSGIAQGQDVTLTPYKNDNPLNGVTTFDLVQISRHILGVEALSSPYRMIAADANRSNSITTFDLVEIRKLILFIENEFPNNTSWRFVDRGFVFPNPANPFATPFPELINVNNIPSDILDADFVAIKVGDVNGNAHSDFTSAGEDRNEEHPLILQTRDRVLQAGETVTLEFTARDFQAAGFQFTLQFDPDVMTFGGVRPALTDAGHVGTVFAADGFLTVSWNQYRNEPEKDEVLMKLDFTCLVKAQLSHTLKLTSAYTPAEAYLSNGEILDVQLTFEKHASSGFELYQNVPNPFSEFTVIGFELPESVRAVLTITDVSGRVVKSVEGNFPAGYNEIPIQRSQLPESGIFYYRLDIPSHTDTKMMLLMR